MRLAVGRVTPCAPRLVGFAARAERRALPTADDHLILLQALRLSMKTVFARHCKRGLHSRHGILPLN